ncbi:hypothetical protein jhhlp_002152 [Lomentospora prolificans]|uniref:Cytoplasmic tRNA 2-thiolation protein 2 n=1 Tax=Lomentospora prolificans TaxID=41688 RepID=A0A2N3NDA1_9PEZI|nr:hypothetical protein jhhlp_002152 [Lomentospora prolificans]
MAEPEPAPTPDSARPCVRCKTNPATVKLRAESTCSTCFQSFTHNKAVKRLGLLRKELVGPREKRTCKYVAGLSFGASSTALVQILDENLKYVRARANPNSPVAYDLVVVHVDTDLRSPAQASEGGQTSSPAFQLLQKYREKFPDLDFRLIPLSHAFNITSIDWSSLPSTDSTLDPQTRMQSLFDALPSVTSKADILRLLVRHILLSFAVENACEGLLLGCTTTALAELTLSEVAKGRGFSVPWQINDGPFPLPKTTDSGPKSMQLYYPLRDIFRNEIHVYLRLVDPSLAALVVTNPAASADVVSHKDLSIEEAMVRYFESVEEGYPAVVANVVRTTGRLARGGASEDGGALQGPACGLCGMAVDESGDARWKGEIGAGPEEESSVGSQLCYGCERSVRG